MHSVKFIYIVHLSTNNNKQTKVIIMSNTIKLGLGYTAIFEDDGGSNNVYITKGKHGGSLQMVEDFGLLDIDYPTSTVPDSIFDKAMEWALTKGY